MREALRHRPHEIARVLVGSRRSGPRRQEIEALCRRHGVSLESVPETRLDALATGTHNGFAAELAASVRAADAVATGDPRDRRKGGPPARSGGATTSRGPGVTPPDVAPSTALGQPLRDDQGEPASGGLDGEAGEERGGDFDLVVLVEDVQDPRNLGALLRVCEGAGVGRVLLRDRGTAPVTPVVRRTSAGASEWLAIERVTNSSATLARLKQEGYWVYGADAAGDPPWSLDLTGKVVLCIGGEEKGLRRLTRETCDRLVGLPMRGHVESLNLSTAAAALLYEAVRQRGG